MRSCNGYFGKSEVGSLDFASHFLTNVNVVESLFSRLNEVGTPKNISKKEQFLVN